jgi:hypothetical protein
VADSNDCEGYKKARKPRQINKGSPAKFWGYEGPIDPGKRKVWEDGIRFILVIALEGQGDQEEESWSDFLDGDKWKWKRWKKWLDEHPN